MTGEMALDIALALRLNDPRRAAEPPLFPDHPACARCRSVRFLDRRRSWRNPFGFRRRVASTPDAWINALDTDRFLGAFLDHPLADALPDDPVFGSSPWIPSAFLGDVGRSFLLGLRFVDGADGWIADWRWSRARQPGRPNRVDYKECFVGAPFPDRASPDQIMDDSSRRLQTALAEIEAFARDESLPPYWAGRFADAARCLDTADPFAPLSDFVKALVPPNRMGLPARRLFAAAETAWVFGAMGSWNDLVFWDDAEANERYNRLTCRLYGAALSAFCASVNSTNHPGGRRGAPAISPDAGKGPYAAQ